MEKVCFSLVQKVTLFIITLWFQKVQTPNLETLLSQQQQISKGYISACTRYCIVDHISTSSMIQMLFIFARF